MDHKPNPWAPICFWKSPLGVLCSALMALDEDFNPFPFMQQKKPQNPTQETTSSFPLPSRNPQFSGFDLLNIHDMNMSHPYGFNDHGLHGMRLIGAQNPTVNETFLPLPSRNMQHSGLGWFNHIGETGTSSGVQGFDMNLSNPYDFYDYGTNNKHEASLHNMGIIGATGQNDGIDLPFPFMQDLQNPTFVGTSVPSYSRNLQGSGFGCLNYGQRSAYGVQSLLPRMEALNLSNPYGFNDYDTDLMYEAALHHIRVNGAADYATLPHHNLETHSGHSVSVAKDPRGSRLLQKKINEGTPQEICKILKELKYHLHELINHPFGHFVIQKLFQSSNISVAQKNALVYLIIVDLQKLKNVCMDDQGNRVIQQILANVKEPSMIHKIAVIMRSISLALMKNFNGGYVIQQCLKLFPPVCQNFLVKRKKMEVNSMLISRLRYRYIRLSKNKYASNVVEELLRYSGADNVAVIARELMKSPEFLNLVQHPYGNYVVQRAVKYTEGPLHERLCSIILSNEKKVSSCLYGKMVLLCARAGCNQ
ncbi:putative pumilio 7, chloroplastic [Glycine max]|nr:putative pumilio 7, chloroplastic [Glycine max]